MAATVSGGGGPSPHGPKAVRDYLTREGVDHEVFHHPPTYSALAEAHAYGAPPHHVMKVVALIGADGWATVALPASERLAMPRVRQLLDDPGLRLATEEEIAGQYPELPVGALPPVGDVVPAPALIDRRLLARDWILIGAGDHRHSLRVKPSDVEHLTHARIVDICEE